MYPAPALPSSSLVIVVSAFTSTADVTFRRTVWTDRTREIVVKYDPTT